MYAGSGYLLIMKQGTGSLPFRKIRLEVEIPEVKIFADPLLEKVFYNLSGNAPRYGGEEMTCFRDTAKEADNGLTLVVEDNGIGIPANDKGRMFNRGFGKNTGLGLLMFREILSITGITLQGTGVPGTGARFEITIPKEDYRLRGE